MREHASLHELPSREVASIELKTPLTITGLHGLGVLQETARTWPSGVAMLVETLPDEDDQEKLEGVKKPLGSGIGAPLWQSVFRTPSGPTLLTTWFLQTMVLHERLQQLGVGRGSGGRIVAPLVQSLQDYVVFAKQMLNSLEDHEMLPSWQMQCNQILAHGQQGSQGRHNVLYGRHGCWLLLGLADQLPGAEPCSVP